MLKDPLFHFALIGAALFALDAWVLDRPEDKTITVPSATVQRLLETHERRTGRPATEPERREILDRWIDDEVLYREALALGLDRDDPVIRGRLVEKMRFLSRAVERADAGASVDMDAYVSPDATSFTQVYLGRGGAARAEEVLQRLRSGAEPGSVGDAFAHPMGARARTSVQIRSRFGAAFESAVAALEVGGWHGPVESSFGLHLVRVEARGPAPGAAAAARSAARRDLAQARRDWAERAAIRRMRASYRVEEAE